LAREFVGLSGCERDQGKLMAKQGDDDRDFWILVVELSDEAGNRRSPELPNLEVIRAVEPSEVRYERLRGKPEHRVGQYGVARRHDLEPDGSLVGLSASDKARRDLIRKLCAEGYTVNRNEDLWHVYVIHLDDAAGPRRNPAHPVVYVGQTSKSPEERFRQHLDGARKADGTPIYSRVVHRHGRELMPELYDHLNPIYSADESRAVERQLADELQRQGYTVKGGH